MATEDLTSLCCDLNLKTYFKFCQTLPIYFWLCPFPCVCFLTYSVQRQPQVFIHVLTWVCVCQASQQSSPQAVWVVPALRQLHEITRSFIKQTYQKQDKVTHSPLLYVAVFGFGLLVPPCSIPCIVYRSVFNLCYEYQWGFCRWYLGFCSWYRRIFKYLWKLYWWLWPRCVKWTAYTTDKAAAQLPMLQHNCQPNTTTNEETTTLWKWAWRDVDYETI